jgi:hypothetical protein
VSHCSRCDLSSQALAAKKAVKQIAKMDGSSSRIDNASDEEAAFRAERMGLEAPLVPARSARHTSDYPMEQVRKNG